MAKRSNPDAVDPATDEEIVPGPLDEEADIDDEADDDEDDDEDLDDEDEDDEDEDEDDAEA